MAKQRSKGCSNRLLPGTYCRLYSKKCKKARARKPKRSRSRKRVVRRAVRRKSSRSKRSRRRVSRTKRAVKRKKCHKSGPKTNNPFLNYLRVFRKKHCNWPITKIAVEGAKCWCSMSKEDKARFYREACQQQKSNKGRARHGASKRVGRAKKRATKRRKSRKRSASRKHSKSKHSKKSRTIC